MLQISFILNFCFGKKLTNSPFSANAEKNIIMNNIITLYNAESFVRNPMHV